MLFRSLHMGGRRPREPIRGFPHDSGVLPRTSVFSVRAPMCRGARSAHGRISTALSTGAFPHDSTNPPPAGPERMCSTTRPAPHRRGAVIPDRTRLKARRKAYGLNAPTGAWCSLTKFLLKLLLAVIGSQCTYRCVVLPNKDLDTLGRVNMCLNAPTGAWCSLTVGEQLVDFASLLSQCAYRCVVLPDRWLDRKSVV